MGEAWLRICVDPTLTCNYTVYCCERALVFRVSYSRKFVLWALKHEVEYQSSRVGARQGIDGSKLEVCCLWKILGVETLKNFRSLLML